MHVIAAVQTTLVRVMLETSYRLLEAFIIQCLLLYLKL